MRKQLIRWFLISVSVTTVVFVSAWTWSDPWLWAYAAAWSAMALYAMLSIDEDLARERFSPPNQGADAGWLHVVRVVALAHVVVGSIDGSRWHLIAPVPPVLRAFAIGAMILTLGMFFRAMRENRFFSAVVRLQTDRGHRVVDSGPYAIVRHPGYAGMIVGLPFSGLALGSWIASAMALVLSALIFRRVLFEDAFLKRNLEGYTDYSSRVRYRVIPHVW